MAYGGITEKIQILEETAYADGGAAGEKVFGLSNRFEWRADTSTTQTFALENAGPTPLMNIDGVLNVTGTHEFEVTNGQALKAIMGTQTGTTSFTLATANALPSYSVKVVDGDGFRIIKGLKYSKFSLSLTRGETIKISADWTAKSIEDSTTFTPTVETKEPLTFMDGYIKVGGSNQTDVESAVLEITRVLAPRRFVESTAVGSKRLISAIVEGVQTLTLNGTQGAKTVLMQTIYGSGTYSQDVRTDTTADIVIARGTQALTLSLTGVRFVSLGRTMQKDEEIALGEFGAIAKTITGTGTYS